MEIIISGVFLILHGLVHLLYFGHSMRFFKLKEEMIWPDDSRVLSYGLSTEATRNIMANSCVLAAIGFGTGAAGLFAGQAWWGMTIISSAIFSSLLFLVGWDWKLKSLPDKGLIAILINAAILILVLGFHWPQVA